MTKKPLTDDVREFLRKPSPCIVATLGKNGQPVTAATWFMFADDDTILLNIEKGRARIRHVERDPRVALTITAPDTWYRTVSIQGRVTDMREDPDLTVIDRVSQHYNGQPYPVRDKQRISMTVAIDRYFTWGM